MSFIEAFIFGLLQGLTEFLPVSSSAHVKLAKILFQIESSEAQVIFDLVCHLGTLLALLLFLREEIMQIFLRDRRKLLHLFLATLPLIPFYFLLKPLRDFASQPRFLGVCLILTGMILFSGQKWKRQRAAKQKLSDLFWIGTMQSAALIPGISRSASTISCATFLGWEAREAVRFSFLLSIPTIIGGNCLEILKLAVFHKMPPVPISACLVGGITAFAVGFFVVRFALSFLEKGNFRPFAWYCFGLGALVTIYLSWG